MTRPARQTARYFPSRSGQRPAFQAFLFTRDLPLGLVPYQSSGRASSFSVTLEPHSDEVAEWLTQFLHIGQYRQHDLSSATEQFLETTVTFMAHTGEAFFELGGSMAESKPPGLPAALYPLPPGPVRRVPGRYLQVVPSADRKAFDGKRYLSVPADRMWNVRLPRELGTPRQHRRMLKQLTRLSETLPDFALQSPDLGRSEYYDFSSHRQAIEILLERTTNRWGTIPSLFKVDGTSEYYLFARRLRWQRSQALLRDHILCELNALLARLGLSSRVVISGLPGPDQIDVVIRQLQAGEIDVDEAMKASASTSGD